MQLLATQALAAGLELGICGELGGEAEFVPLWVAMGYQKLSMTASQILPLRSLISKVTVQECDALLKNVLASQDENEVKEKLEQGRKRQ